MMPGLIIGTCPTPNLGCVDPVITITQMYKTNAFSLKNSIFQNNVRHHEMLAPPPPTYTFEMCFCLPDGAKCYTQ